jgi:hypothetical protein
MDFPSQSVSFDPDAFNELLNFQGVRFVHYKALRCPVGMTDVDDNNRPHEDHAGCSNGFIYYKSGIVTASLMGNSNNQNSSDMGLIENSSIVATFPQFYDESETKISLAPFDRLFLNEEEKENRILVPTWHLQLAHQSKVDKLYFPCENVEILVDSRGNEYKQDVDFCIENGCIKWGDRWPGYQLDVGRGTLYTVRYQYRPYFYVSRLMHEIRVAQIDSYDGRKLVRMPQQALLNREYTFSNESADSKAKDANSLRQTPSPEDGWGSPR